jgi:hypothetical protein
VTIGNTVVAKKKSTEPEPSKRYGTLIRVSDEFADALRQAAAFEGLSQGEFATRHLLAVVEKHYRDAVLKEAKRIGGDS